MGGITSQGYLKRIYDIFNGSGGKIVVQASDLEIGAVELKNAADDTRAKVVATNAAVDGDVGLVVAAPGLRQVLGATADVVDLAGGATTINAKLRGLIQILAGAYNSTVGFLNVGFKADLVSGVNVCQEKTLTAASTDYTIAIPDTAKIVVVNPSARIRIALEAIDAVSTQAGSGDTTSKGRFCPDTADTAVVLAAGIGRTLHLRSTSAGVVVNISFL